MDVKFVTVAAYIACALIWSTTWFAIRLCIAPGGYPTYLAASLRFLLAAAILGGLWLAGVARPGARNARELAWVCLAGVLNAVGYGMVYAGEQHIPGGLAAVIYGTLPLFTALFAWLSKTERVTPNAIVGSFLSLIGIVAISADRLAVSRQQAVGVALVVGSVVSCTLYTIILKRRASGQHPLATTALFLAATSLVMTSFAAVYEGKLVPWPPPVAPTIAVVYLGVVGSVVAFAAYFYLLKRVKLMTITTLVFIEPILALAVDARWEHTVRLDRWTYAGAALTLGGVLVSLWSKRDASPAQPAT
jgi:drug/metabolite transporter (DMT)-like permease